MNLSTGRQLSIIVIACILLVASCGGTVPTATPMPVVETPGPPTAIVAATVAPSATATAAATATTTTPPATLTVTATEIPPTPTPTATAEPSPAPTTLPPLSGSGGGIMAFVSGPVSSSSTHGTMEIYLMNADGSGQRPLTNNRVDDICPVWSPVGDQIAFIANQDGNWDLFVVDVEAALQGGSLVEPQRLTSTPADEYGPSWSPDGSEIAFSANRGGSWGVWALNVEDALQGTAAGGNAWQLADDAGPQSRVDWSPDGELIAFVSIRDGNREIYTMKADGNDPQRLTDNDSRDFAPAWSPDGAQLAYTSRVDTSYDVYVMDAGGGNKRRLTQDDADDWWATWSPHGTKLAFSSNNHDAYWHDIYVTSAGGTGKQRLAASKEDEWFPDWRPEANKTAQAEDAGTDAILLVFGSRFIYDIYRVGRPLLEEAGYTVVVASDTLSPLKGKSVSSEAQPDLLLEKVDVEDYQAIVFLCDNDFSFGGGRPETDRIAQDAVAQGKVLAAICAAPRVLGYADVVQGKTVTAEPSKTCNELNTLYGATCTGEEVERDGLLITAKDRFSTRSFVAAILEALQEK